MEVTGGQRLHKPTRSHRVGCLHGATPPLFLNRRPYLEPTALLEQRDRVNVCPLLEHPFARDLPRCWLTVAMSRTLKILLVAVVIGAAAVLGLLWVAGYPPFDDTPEEANIADAAAAASDETAPDDDPTPPLDNIDGSWIVVANEDATFVGYRINEVLNTIGDFEVVGRTSEVTGTLVAYKTRISTATVTAQMGSLTTDRSGRDNAMRSQSLETEDFPEATFDLSTPIDIGSIPVEGETVTVTANGDLTIHGVTKTVDFPLEATVTNGLIVVVGQLQIELADFDISAPSAAIVAKVEDVAILELSLLFGRP